MAWFAAPLAGRIAASLHVREPAPRLGEILAWLGAKVLVHDADGGFSTPALRGCLVILMTVITYLPSAFAFSAARPAL